VVTSYKLIARDTVEEDIDSAKPQKELIQATTAAMKTSAALLEEIQELLS
jgi:hypothetical protein